MCGIAGFINKDGSAASVQKLKQMTDAIAHRGPDAEGQLCEGNIALGHRRLSIIDLSDAGRQPMESADGRFVITFNGEIYNYRELKEELSALGAVFTNDTDTQVIIEAYRFWGPGCLPRFNGMWAFALLDRMKREVFLSRDRFAVKPLYLLNRDDLFMFASESKAIIAAQPEENIPDLVQIHRFVGITAPENIDEHSWYANIRIFPAASYGIYSLESNAFDVKTYWEPDIELFRKKWIEGKNPVNTFRELFDDAVKIRLRADVEVGTCLSGGLDSSAIVGCCNKRHGVTMRTFSSRYSDKSCDEGEFIDSVNRFTNSKAVPVYPDNKPITFVEAFQRINANHDGPSAGASLYSQYSVFREVGRHVKVVLDGQGADELFCGYAGFFNPALRKAAKTSPRIVMIRTLSELLRENDFIDASQLSADVGIRVFGVDNYLRLVEKIQKEAAAQAAQMKSSTRFTPDFSALVSDSPDCSCRCKSNDEITQMCLDQTLVYSIPQLCHNEDSNSMNFSVEVRMPFLDYRIVEFALALDSSYKIRGAWQKWIIRRALKPYLPVKVRRRRNKMGYPAPFFRWLRESEEKEQFKEIIFSFAKRNIVPTETIETYYYAHMRGEANMEQMLFRYLSLELWLRTCDFDRIPDCAEASK